VLTVRILDDEAVEGDEFFTVELSQPETDGGGEVGKMVICLPPQGTPPPNTAADTAHSAHSIQPVLRPHRAALRAEDQPPQTHRPHSISLCSPLSEGPDPGSAQRHVHAGLPAGIGIRLPVVTGERIPSGIDARGVGLADGARG